MIHDVYNVKIVSAKPAKYVNNYKNIKLKFSASMW